MAKKVAWGIDVGDSSVKAVRLRRVEDRAIVEEYDQEECGISPEGEDEVERNERIRMALRILRERNDLSGAEIVVCMPGRGSFLRSFPLPPIERKRLPDIVRNEARQLIPFPIEEVVWDYHIMGEPLPGEEFDITLFAMKIVPIRVVLSNLSAAKIDPDVIQISNVSIYNLFYYERGGGTGTVLLDIGSGNTDLVIFEGEKFWARHLPISGNDLTASLQDKFKLSFDEAEKLKREATEAGQGERIFEIMRGRVEELIGEIHRSIGYYKSQVKGAGIREVILMGNSFKFDPLANYFREALEYTVAAFDRLERVQMEPSIDEDAFLKEIMGYGPAIGAALQGLGLGQCGINLLPRDVIFERELRRKHPFAIGVAAAVALWWGVDFVGARSGGTSPRQLMPMIQQKVSEVQSYKNAWQTERSRWSAVEKEIEELNQLTEWRDEWSHLIRGLYLAFNKIPGEVLVDEIRAKIGGKKELLIPVGLPAPAGEEAGTPPPSGGPGPGETPPPPATPGEPAPPGGPGVEPPTAPPAPGAGGGPGGVPAPGPEGPAPVPAGPAGGPSTAPSPPPAATPTPVPEPTPPEPKQEKKKVKTIKIYMKGRTSKDREFLLRNVTNRIRSVRDDSTGRRIFVNVGLPKLETKEAESVGGQVMRVFTIEWVMPVPGTG